MKDDWDKSVQAFISGESNRIEGFTYNEAAR